MIIRIIATALIQCTVRTHAGWITLAGAVAACSWLAVMLDMAVPPLKLDTRIYAKNLGFVTAMHAIRFVHAGCGVNEKASRVAPARLFASCLRMLALPVGTRQVRGRCDVTTPAS